MWIGCGVFALGLGVFLYTGTLIRYLADDYCFSAVLKTDGFWGAQASFYINTSSRFPVMFLISLSEFFGPLAIRLLPGVTLVLWTGGLFALFDQVRQRLNGSLPRLVSVLGALMVVFFAVYLAPNRLQSIYWRSGMLTYTFPLVVGAWLAAFLVNRSASLSRIASPAGLAGAVAALLLAFVAGGFSETYSAVQVGALGLALAGCVFWLRGEKRKKSGVLLAAAMAGALAGMLVLVLSPANRGRMAVMPATPPLPKLVGMSLFFAWDFTRDTFGGYWLPVGVFLAASFLIGISGARWLEPGGASFRWRPVLTALAAIPLAAYLLVVCCVAPTAFGESAPPEGRAWIIARFTLLLASFAWWGLLGWAVARRWGRLLPSWLGLAAAVGMLLLWGYSLRAVWISAGEIPKSLAWAQAWDRRDALIRSGAQQGQRIFEVDALDSRNGVMELGDQDDLWVNGCAQVFYGVDKIKAIP